MRIFINHKRPSANTRSRISLLSCTRGSIGNSKFRQTQTSSNVFSIPIQLLRRDEMERDSGIF